MTYEVYPNVKDFNLISDVVESYLDFISFLKIAREAEIDNFMLLQILSLFNSVKIDNITINELKTWLDELDGLIEE